MGDYALCSAIVGLKPASMQDVAAWIWTGAARPHATGYIWISKSLRERAAGDEAEDTEVYLGLISIVFVAAPRGKTCSFGALLWGQRMQDEWKRTDSPPPHPNHTPTPTHIPSQRLKKEIRIDEMTEA